MIEKTAKGVGSFLSILSKPYHILMVFVSGLWILSMVGVYFADISTTIKMVSLVLIVIGGGGLIIFLSTIAREDDVQMGKKVSLIQAEIALENKEKEMEVQHRHTSETKKKELEIAALKEANDKAIELLQSSAPIHSLKLTFGEGVTLELKKVGSLTVIHIKHHNVIVGKMEYP